MPVLENEQNPPTEYPNSPGAPGILSYFQQGRDRSTGMQVTTDGDMTLAGDLTVNGSFNANGTTDWYNIAHYGASPTASAATNDAAITAAVAAAVAAGGGVVYVPAGTYNISQAVTIVDDAVSLKGAGMDASILSQTSTTAHGISIISTGPRYITIEDLLIDGPSSGTGEGIHIETTDSSASASIDISHVFVRQFGSHGIYIDTVVTSVWQDVRVQTVGGDGFYIDGGTSLTMIGCYANGVSGRGYFLTGVSYASLINCACDTPTLDGYSFAGCTSLSLYGCGFEVGLANGYKFSGCSNATAIACYNRGNAAIAYWITGASNRVQLMNAREITPGGTATAAVQVDAGSTATLFGNQGTTGNSLATSTTSLFLSTNLEIHSAATASVRADRAATTNAATYFVQTAGTDRWGLGMRTDSTNDVHLYSPAQTTTALLAEDRATQPNLSLLSATKDYQGGVGMIYIADRTTAPSGQAAAGSLIWSSSQRFTSAGSVRIATAGQGLMVAEGANAKMGTLTLNGATPVVVNTTAVTANSRIFLTTNTPGGTPAFYWVSARTAGTSFSVTGTAGDTSTVAWMIVEPA